MSEVGQIMVEVIRTDKAQSGIIWVDGGGWIQKDRLCGDARYERSEARRNTRAGSYEQALHTKAG